MIWPVGPQAHLSSLPFLMLFSMIQPHWPACCSPTHIMCLLLSSGLWYLLFLLLGILPLPYPSVSYLLIDYTYYFKIDVHYSINPFLTALLTQLWVRCPPNALRDHFTTTAVPFIIIYDNCLLISSLGSHLFEGKDHVLLTTMCCSLPTPREHSGRQKRCSTSICKFHLSNAYHVPDIVLGTLRELSFSYCIYPRGTILISTL